MIVELQFKPGKEKLVVIAAFLCVAYENSGDRKMDMNRKSREVREEVIRALSGNEFQIYLQKQLDLQTGIVYGEEALIRWEHPTRGKVMPDQFIPICEKSFLITEIDIFVFERVCRYIRRQIDEGKDSVPIAVNISRKSLIRTKFNKKCRELLCQYGLNPSNIELEITESVVVEREDELIQGFRRLKDIGFTMIMDDFGAGSSTLHSLQQLPIDILKIDKKLIDHILDQPRARIIIASIIDLAKQLNVKVVAEGIETHEQEELLKQLGCDIGQGFLFGRPISIEEMMSN